MSTDPSPEAIKSRVRQAAERLTSLTEENERLWRRREFLAELRRRGNWLAGNPSAPAPAWVEPWQRYFESVRESPQNRRLQAALSQARAELHSPEFETAVEALRCGEAGANVEWAIAYLEADPWYFRSGYLKGRLARWLRQVQLSHVQQGRLQAVILAALQKGSRSEQVEYRRLARRLDTPAFRNELRRLAASKGAGTARRAALAMRFCELNDTPGRDLRGAR